MVTKPSVSLLAPLIFEQLTARLELQKLPPPPPFPIVEPPPPLNPPPAPEFKLKLDPPPPNPPASKKLEGSAAPPLHPEKKLHVIQQIKLFNLPLSLDLPGFPPFIF